ncbi:virulence factor SrfC family protein, partial [Streptococcus suis]
IRIQSDLAKAEGMLKQSWGAGGLLQQTILERFGNYDWISDWSNGKPFDNLFLVRKPGFPVPFLEIENGKEIAEREQG